MIFVLVHVASTVPARLGGNMPAAEIQPATGLHELPSFLRMAGPYIWILYGFHKILLKGFLARLFTRRPAHVSCELQSRLRIVGPY